MASQDQNILDVLENLGIHAVTLLVVADSGWSDRELRRLHAFQQAGYEFAGHGCTHQCAGVKSFGHTLHSLIMSRNAAEHLSLPSHQIAALIERCFQWFLDVGLSPPALYIPPAWAMGRISRESLAGLPFTMYEYLMGVYNIDSRTFSPLPLVGYEADTIVRAWSLRMLNALNHGVSRLTKLPLRIAIHPDDLTLGLSSDVLRFLKYHKRFLSYRQVFHPD